LVYSQIWLNLPWDDSHFSLHFPMDIIAILATKNNSYKKNTDYPSGENFAKEK
jgi:hypothetical protein